MKNSPGKFFPQLEGLRAFAILFVIIAHWQVEKNPCAYWIRWAGIWGITYFYVLSGFLLGNILLNEKEQLKLKKNSSVLQVLKAFYARRILRIFPAYYLLLIVLLVIGFPVVISKIYPWLFLYCSNIYIFLHGWIWPLSHFWTLSTEEHFILIFPLIILFVPHRFTVHAIVAVGISGIVCRTTLYLFKFEHYHIFSLSCFDSLAIGALLAFLKIKNISIPYLKTLLISSFILYIFLPMPWMYFTGKTLLKVMVPSAAVLSMCIIYIASEERGIDNFFKYILQNKITLYIGKTGYGIYLYHLLIPDLRIYLLHISGYSISSLPAIWFTDSMLLLIITTASFYLFENPIYSLKKHFQYNYQK